MSINIEKLTENLNIISSLPDQPTLTSQELKSKFDEASNIIKKYLNENLITSLNTQLDKFDSELMKKVNEANWPIGRGFIDFTDTDYSNYLGFTWEKELVGMTPVGLDVEDSDFNEVGKTGGEKSHIITTSELPSHEHPVGIGDAKVNLDVDNDHNNIISRYAYNNGGYYYDLNNGIKTGSTGGGQAHNNLQPYKVVNFWKRIS